MTRHIHILGICGTFMGSLALLARDLGYRVSGVDQQVYPPMSDQLESAGIELHEGYENHALDRLAPDWVIIGNAMSRGNPAVEYVLDNALPYCSGPEWLSREILQGRHVLAVAGTHGKTTTSSMLAWILEYAGLQPGFLIGGVPENFGQSARLGAQTDKGHFFVIEADEYDTAFFDKRSKFVHYRPNTLVLNNLEYDHADIFPDLAAIQRQFHHVVRTVPQSGCVLMPEQQSLREVIDMGLWSRLELLSGAKSNWQVVESNSDQSEFTLSVKKGDVSEKSVVSWNLCGEHNLQNAIAAIAASMQVGVSLQTACKALGDFVSVKRRLELLDEINGVRVFDDFAHHPTAIKTTLNAVKHKYPQGRIVAVIEPRSNTMKMGVHDAQLADALSLADTVFWYTDSNDENARNKFSGLDTVQLFEDIDTGIEQIAAQVSPGDSIVIMSNGGFQGIHQKLLIALKKKID